MTLTEIIILCITGLFAGIVGGTLGVGGGIIIVPALVFILNFTQHSAQGTSLMVLLFPIGIFAVINYAKNGFIDYKFAVILIIACTIGSYFGSLLSVNLPEKTLKQIFGVFMLLVSLKMILGK